MNASLRSNICFGSDEVDIPRLQEAISSACMVKDLEAMKDGLDTEIGGEFTIAWIM